MNILIKPASSSCNLKCDYCFYHDEASIRQTPNYGMMSIDTLKAIVSKALKTAKHQCTFGFQGGEPTLTGLDYFKEFIRLVKKNNTRGIKINNSLQTNGRLIDNEWASFFADNDFLIGLSMDGNEVLHDMYRKDTEGLGTHKHVKRAAKVLRRHGAEFNVLCVVTAQAAQKAGSIYRYFMHHDFVFQQYIPCLDPFEEKRQEYSLTPKLYAQFLKDMFDVWYKDRENNVFVYNRYFENLAGILRGFDPESCDTTGKCNVQYAIEADGSVYPCDFYMLDEYKLGNIKTDSFKDIDKRRTEIGFIEESILLPEECKECKWLLWCRNGCKRTRNRDGKSIYCKANMEFFEYAYERLVMLVR